MDAEAKTERGWVRGQYITLDVSHRIPRGAKILTELEFVSDRPGDERGWEDMTEEEMRDFEEFIGDSQGYPFRLSRGDEE